MKAIRFHEYGGLDVLRYEEVPDPEVGPGEVLVRVGACALNHLDLWQRRGLPGLRLPHSPGSDVAGEVVQADGADVPRGLRVMLQPGLSCGQCAQSARARTISVPGTTSSDIDRKAATPSW